MKPFKVLIIDDEPLIRKSLSLVGKKQGYIMREAQDGEEGKLAWIDFDPDLVFLDLVMPKKDGFTLLRELQKPLRAKVVMISASKNLIEKVSSYPEISLFIQKPFEDIFDVFKKGEELLESLVES